MRLEKGILPLKPAHRIIQPLGVKLGQVHWAVFLGFKLASQGEAKGETQFTQKQRWIYSCSRRSSDEGLHIQGVLSPKVRYTLNKLFFFFFERSLFWDFGHNYPVSFYNIRVKKDFFFKSERWKFFSGGRSCSSRTCGLWQSNLFFIVSHGPWFNLSAFIFLCQGGCTASSNSLLLSSF